MSNVIDAMKIPKLSHVWKREPHEHYCEPSWCSERLFAVERFAGPLLDPACGFGTIVNAARKAGIEASGSDLVNRGFPGVRVDDFLAQDWHPVASIVTNPPFKKSAEFAVHACKLARKVAMIIPTTRLHAASGWLNALPLRCVWLMTPRPSMPPGYTIAAGEKPGGGTIDFSWVIFERGYSGQPELRWLHRDGGKAQ